MTTGTETEHSLLFEGRRRTWKEYLPRTVSDGVFVPVVLVLHGGAANADYAIRMSGMHEEAEKHGFLAVYPNGTGIYEHAVLTWNAGRCCGYACEQGVDDSGFIRALLEDIESRHALDRSRIFATGMSNGAMMAGRLACDLPGVFRAIAPVGGTLNLDVLPAPEGPPVSVLHIHGLEDRHAPFAGGLGPATRYPRQDRPVMEAVRYWIRRNGCSQKVQSDLKEGIVRRQVWQGSGPETEVRLVTLDGEGHTWPGGQPGIRNGNVDPPTPLFSATAEIAAFFFTRKA